LESVTLGDGACIGLTGFEHQRENVRRASNLLKAMCNEHRLLILCYLTQGEQPSGVIGQFLGASQSATSQHLSRLRRDGLVRTRRQSQTIFYSLCGEEAATVLKTLYSLYCDGDQGRELLNPR